MWNGLPGKVAAAEGVDTFKWGLYRYLDDRGVRGYWQDLSVTCVWMGDDPLQV